MEDQNVIILLDKFKKLLELGNKPKVIGEMDYIILELERNLNKKKGKRFQEMLVSQTGTEDLRNIQKNYNQIIKFLNERFPL